MTYEFTQDLTAGQRLQKRVIEIMEDPNPRDEYGRPLENISYSEALLKAQEEDPELAMEYAIECGIRGGY